MTPFPSLIDLPHQLRQAAVRDLAWAILAPPLLAEMAVNQRHPLSASDWVQTPERLAAWLTALDRHSEPLDAWLAAASTQRLGRYYERLWQFALEAAPGVRLIAANLPIRDGGKTLGELDLLFEDAEGVHHVELAIKFYLGIGDARRDRYEQWLGPNSQDRLDLKVEHLLTQQMPMAERPQSRLVLAALGVSNVCSELWMSGYLFSSWSAHNQNTLQACNKWVRYPEWQAFIADRPAGSWQILPRERWLAPAYSQAENRLSEMQLNEQLAALCLPSSAHLLVRLIETQPGEWREAERAFLVPESWPKPRS